MLTVSDSISIQPFNKNKYNFYFNGYRDRIEPFRLPAANFETGHQFLIDGELITVDANGYVYHPDGGIWSFGAYKELVLYPVNPLLWTKSGALDIVAAPGSNVGAFVNAGKITDNGTVTDRYLFWRSATSGAPTGTQFVAKYYVPDTSGEVRITFADATAGTESVYAGEIGSAVVTSQAAGTLTLLSDIEYLGGRLAKFLVNFTNKANVLTMGIGPNSTDGGSIITRGASVCGAVGTGDITSERPFTNGNPGNVVTFSSTNAGLTNSRGVWALGDVPKLLNCLDGIADGAVLLDDDFSINTSGNYTAIQATKTYESSSFLRLVSTATGAAGAARLSFLTIGDRYSVTFRAKGTASENFASIGNNSQLGIPIKNPSLSSVWQDYEYRFTANSTTMRFYINSDVVGNYFDIDDIKIQKISPAQGEIQWTGKVLGLPAVSAGLLACNTTAPILSLEADGSFKANDMTNNVSVASSYTAGETVTVKIPYATDEMNIHEWADSGTTTTFDGSFNPGTLFGIGSSGNVVTESVKIFNRPRSEI